MNRHMKVKNYFLNYLIVFKPLILKHSREDFKTLIGSLIIAPYLLFTHLRVYYWFNLFMISGWSLLAEAVGLYLYNNKTRCLC